MNKQRLVEAMGVGVALGCITWVLGHLVAFDFLGSFMIGESNKVILYSEIIFVSIGLACFVKTVLRGKNKTRP